VAIYTPYVTDTAITFESDPPPPAEMAVRIATVTRTHAWVVLENQGRVVGYAYGGPFQSRAAYRWSCEVSVYLEHGRRRTGGGRALYDALFARLAERGFRTAVAGMTLPNDASVGLHRAMGSNPSEPTGASAGSTARGTTSPGFSGRSPRTEIRPPNPVDVLATGQSNSPVRTPALNAAHCAGVNIRAGPAGFLLSRTARWPPGRSAISTQLPVLVLREDFL